MKIDQFIDELKKININISDFQLKQLDQYYNLLIEWNEKINLTRITEKDEVYLKHFYDSATLSTIIDLNEVDNLCDIGTGAGFPGIVIKILFPNLNITLVDSLNKRIIFLNEVIKQLDLKKITTVHSRIEDFARNNREQYDLVTARAVAKLNVLLEYAAPIIKINRYFVAMKANIEEEFKLSLSTQKKLDMILTDRKEIILPVENSIRNLLFFSKKSKTSLQFPRSGSIIKKKPL